MRCPNPMPTIKKKIDIDASCFPTQLPLPPQRGFDGLDRFPDFPDGLIGLDRHHGIQKIFLPRRTTNRGSSVQTTSTYIVASKVICQ